MKPTSKLDAMRAFEDATKDWGLSYERVEVEGEVCYAEYITGTAFGSFWLGWCAREEADPEVAWLRTRLDEDRGW